MADNDDKRTDDTSGKKTLTLKGGPGLGNRPGMSRGPSRSTVVVEKRTRVVPKPNVGAPSGTGGRPAGAGRPGQGRPMQQSRAPLGLSAAEAEARRQALAQAGARFAEDKERFAAEEARRIEDDNRRRQIREEAARQEEERRRAEETRQVEVEAAPEPAQPAEARSAEPAPAREAFVPASQRNPGPRPCAPSPVAPARPAARSAASALPAVPVKASATQRLPVPVRRRTSPRRHCRRASRGDRRPAGGGMAPIGNVPPAPPSEADGRKIRTGAPQHRPTTEAELENARRASRAQPERPTRRVDDGSSRGRLTVASATTESDRDRGPSLAAMRRRRDKKMGRNQQDAPKLSREVIIPEAITVAELANRMAERSVTVIKLLMQQGQMATINDVIDADTAELIAAELGHTVKRVSDADVEEGLYDIRRTTRPRI